MRAVSPWYYFSKSICSTFYRAFWRLSIDGVENIPADGPVIIASNHRSFADPPLIGVGVPRVVHFLAKKELFDFKPFGWLISKLNAHPLNRAAGIGALREAQNILEEGGVVILFPEGRRSDSDELQKPKSGVGMLAMKSQAPIVPAYIHNSGHLFEFKKVMVRFGRPLHPANSPDYDHLAAQVMLSIQKLKDQTLGKI